MKQPKIAKSHAPKHKPPKGVMPPQLAAHSFREHPENINKYGAPKSFIDLRKFFVDIGGEKIQKEITLPDGKKKMVEMTRLEALIIDLYNGKREEVLTYGFGKVPDKLEVSGTKTIRVTIEKKEGK